MKTADPMEVQAKLDSDEPIEIIDIRTRGEFEHSHIEGARCCPAAELSAEALLFLRQLLPSEPIYLISETGDFAQLRARDLERQGLDSIVVVAGGMRRWRERGLPLAPSFVWAMEPVGR